jgi:hypothetical protein
MAHPIRAVWLAGDVDGVVRCFREDGSFHSPVIGAPGFTGYRSITDLMGVVFDVTSDFEFTFELTDGSTQVHGFSARFNGHRVSGLIQLDVDEAGLIQDLWVYARPLTGVARIAAAMGPGLATLQSRALGVAARAAVQPLIGMALGVDTFGRRIVGRMNRTARTPSGS